MSSTPKRRAGIFLALLFLCLHALGAFAQSGGSQQITPSVVSGGGGTSSSNNGLRLDGTAAQSVTATSSGGAYTLSGGFWPGAGAGTPDASLLSVPDVTATYGGTVTLTATLSAGGVNLSNMPVSFSLNGTSLGSANTDTNGIATLNNVSLSGLNAGTYTGGITAAFAGDISFAQSNGAGQLTVQKATPLLQVAGGNFTFDNQPHTAVVSLTGVNNEALSPLTVLYNNSASLPVNAGSYAITVSYAGNQNYTEATNNGQSIIINQARQTISFGALPDKTFGDGAFQVNATSSSGLPVSFLVVSGPATLSGNTLTINGAGTVLLRASQAGDNNFLAAAPVERAFAVNKATATVTLSNLGQSYDGTAKAPAVTTTPAGLSFALSYSRNGQPVASPTSAGSYNVTATINDANYQGSATGVLVISTATPAITWTNPANITFGTALGGSQLNALASVPGSFSYSPPSGTVLNVGTHQLSVTFTPTDSDNYAIASGSVSLTIDPVTAAALNLDSATYTVNEGDPHVTITVNRTGHGAGAASVEYRTSSTAALQPCNLFNGIASSRCDYATTVGTLRFAPGETSKTIFIPLIDDAYAEGPESFTITLSNAQGENLGAVSTATITITDNETVTGSNPISQADFFIRQQYIDFLGREPEPAGLAGWLTILTNCGTSVQQPCDMVEVSSGFIRSPEFAQRGYFIFRFYVAALGRNPTYAEFMRDMGRVSGFLSDAQLEAERVAFVQELMTRPEFVNRYGSLSNPAFVDMLIQVSGLQNHPQRGAWIDVLNNQMATRAQVMRALVESKEVSERFYTTAFVVMQYFGYLRRDPDAAYQQWIETLNQTGDYRTMIKGFLNSNEYVLRFGP